MIIWGVSFGYFSYRHQKDTPQKVKTNKDDNKLNDLMSDQLRT